MLALFVDIVKTFDNLYREIKLVMLEHNDVRGVVLNWLSSYSTD